MLRTMILACFAVLLAAGEARRVPPFPASFVVHPGDPQITEASFAGKVTLVIFVQDTDQKDNVLNYDLFGKLTSTWGGDERIILLGVKVDGGDARKYLNARDKGRKWIAAADPGGTWRDQVVPEKHFYAYAVIDPARNVVDTGKAMAHKRIPTGRTFHLLRKDILALYGKDAKYILPRDRDYGDELAPVKRRVELRDYLGALDLLRKNSKAEHAKQLFADLGELIVDDVGRWCDSLSPLDDRNAPTAPHYPTWCKLAGLAKDLGASAAGKRAAAAVNKYRGRMRKEIAAEEAYHKLKEQMDQASEERRQAHGAKAWATLARRYQDTHYGAQMQAEAEKLTP